MRSTLFDLLKFEESPPIDFSKLKFSSKNSSWAPPMSASIPCWDGFWAVYKVDLSLWFCLFGSKIIGSIKPKSLFLKFYSGVLALSNSETFVLLSVSVGSWPQLLQGFYRSLYFFLTLWTPRKGGTKFC